MVVMFSVTSIILLWQSCSLVTLSKSLSNMLKMLGATCLRSWLWYHRLWTVVPLSPMRVKLPNSPHAQIMLLVV